MRQLTILILAMSLSNVLLSQCDNLNLKKTEAAYLKSLFYRTLKPGEKSIPMNQDQTEEDSRRFKLEVMGFQDLATRDGNLDACIEFLWGNGQIGLLDQSDPDQRYYTLNKGHVGLLRPLACRDEKKAVALVEACLDQLKVKAMSDKPGYKLNKSDPQAYFQLEQQIGFIRQHDRKYFDAFITALAKHDPEYWGKSYFSSLVELNPDDPLVREIIATEKALAKIRQKKYRGKPEQSSVWSTYVGLLSHWYFVKQDAAALGRLLHERPMYYASISQYLHRLKRDDITENFAKSVKDAKLKSDITRFIVIFNNGTFDKSVTPQPDALACPQTSNH